MTSMRLKQTPFIAILLVCFLAVLMMVVSPAWGQEAAGPQVTAAEVTTKGDVSVTFDQTIADPAGTQAQFTVTADGTPVNITAMELTNTPGKIKLVLEEKAQAGQMITITYTQSSDEALQIKSADGEAVESFTYQIGEPAEPPVLSANNEQYTLGEAVEITFAGNPDWTAKITNVKVNDVSYKGQFAIADSSITIPAEAFAAAGEYAVVVKATAYKDAEISVTIEAAEPAGDPVQPPVDPVEPPADPAEPAEQAELKDIQGHWGEDNIKQLVAMGAIKGYEDGTFAPDKGITRAEFVTVLVKALALASDGGKTFTDTAGHWAEQYIAAANALGIVAGYDADTFGPDDSITREQMAVMVVKAAQLPTAAGELAFADKDSISDWAVEAITTASENQLINGYEDNTFRPQQGASRAEAVTVILNSL